MDRRKFLKASCILGVLGVAGAGILIESCKKKDSSSGGPPQGPNVNFDLDLSQSANSALNSSGGAVASNGVIVVNSSGTFVAIAQSCTHNGCAVGYNQGGNNFVCPCHGGTYDINGKVTGGPPPPPLKKKKVAKKGNTITIFR